MLLVQRKKDQKQLKQWLCAELEKNWELKQMLAKLSSDILGEVGEKYLSKIRRVELTWLLSLHHQGLLSIWLKPLSPLV